MPPASNPRGVIAKERNGNAIPLVPERAPTNPDVADRSITYDQHGAETLSSTLSSVLTFRQPLGIEHLGPLCDPLLGRHWPIGDDVVADFTVNLVNVTPFARSSILEPEANSTDVTSESLLIEAFNDPFIACIAPSF